MHWADAFAPDVAINAVTNDAVDPDSLQPEFKVCAVAVTAIETETAPAELTPQQVRAPVDALAAVLDTLPSSATLTADERLYLAGLMAGIRANPPSDELPLLPAATPLSPGNRVWIDGVLAGIFSRSAIPSASQPGRVAGEPIATVVWASQTGTAEEFAATCVEQLSGAGIAARPRGAEEVAVADLTGTLLFVVSTTGDGDPPDNGIALWDALAAAEPGDLDDLRFSVLGFGDSSYADFCGFARKLDARLEYLGAQRIVDRALCEPDFEATAQAWTGRVTAALSDRDLSRLHRNHPHNSHIRGLARFEPRSSATSHCAVRRPIRTSAASDFRLPAGTLEYDAGDALGVWPYNAPESVAEFLELTGLDGAR